MLNNIVDFGSFVCDRGLTRLSAEDLIQLKS